MPIAICPCGSGRPAPACCAPYLEGAPAPTAEALMRSRYTAYTELGGAQGARALAYLLASWHASTRPATVEQEVGTRWLGLTVKRHRQTGPGQAEVDFVARYRVSGGSAQRLEERSRFVFDDGRWFYVDGVHSASPGTAGTATV